MSPKALINVVYILILIVIWLLLYSINERVSKIYSFTQGIDRGEVRETINMAEKTYY